MALLFWPQVTPSPHPHPRFSPSGRAVSLSATLLGCHRTSPSQTSKSAARLIVDSRDPQIGADA
jgi:hypothetical protein